MNGRERLSRLCSSTFLFQLTDYYTRKREEKEMQIRVVTLHIRMLESQSKLC